MTNPRRPPILEPPSSDPQRLENTIIQTVLGAALPLASVRVGPGDDAAVLRDGTTVTVDALVEGVHWDWRLSPADVGWKAVAVNASDLGAMGARPEWMLLALCVPTTVDHDWIAAFAAGLGEASRAFGVGLVGGDTTRSPGPRIVSVTMGGPLVAAPITRSGGSAGDDLWVTGTPGLAGAGYVLADPPDAALSALRRPRPPVAFALELAREGLATAMMDLSDGLSSDLPRLCARSGVGAVVQPEHLPLHPALEGLPEALTLQAAAGDDYELLFAALPGARDRIVALASRHDVPVSRIGRLMADPAVVLEGAGWPEAPFVHFRERAP